jgi:hypothetical protein
MTFHYYGDGPFEGFTFGKCKIGGPHRISIDILFEVEGFLISYEVNQDYYEDECFCECILARKGRFCGDCYCNNHTIQETIPLRFSK